MTIKQYSLYILTATILLGGCKKQLDQFDPDTISEVNAFQTIEHVQNGLNGAYAKYGAYANDMYVSALLSDEGKLGVNNAGQGALTYRYQYSYDNTTGGDVTPAYFGYYSLIDQVNRVLPFVNTVTAPPDKEATRAVIRGQLLGLRAIGHFGLLRAYGDSKTYNPTAPGVPVMTESNAAARPSRNTMGEVMTQIEKDLTDAKALLPAVTASTFSDTGLNRINIAGYQARIALYKGDYASAITYATEVINSGVKPLVTGSDFAGIWTDQNTNEVLFRVRYLTSNAIGSMWTAGSSIYIAPSDKLVASYSTDDIRLPAYIGNAGGSNYVNKFYASSRGARVVDIKAMRTAEMYLIRAEANAKKSSPDLVAGAADLNTLRAMRIANYTAVSFSSATDLLNAVLQERFKELAFEGFRFFDLKRNNLPVQRNASDANPEWQVLPANSFRWVLPIPQDELNANPNMDQNTGY